MEAAIYEDCHTLIEEFVSEGSVEFESFCSKWKSMMFQHMYAPQTSVVEVIQTTCAIFHMAKRSICAKDEFGKYLSTTEGNEERNLLRRIGGMYLMYAVYFKQPTKEYVKVCVSLETWREMVSFIESLSTDSQMNSARYTFWRLYKADAFRFSALDYCLGLEELADYDKITEEHQEVEQTEVVRVKAKHKLLLIPEIQETLKEMTAQEDKYNELKRSIIQSQNQTQETLPPTEIFHDIQSVFNNIKNILDEKPFESGHKRKNSNLTRRELKRKAAGIIDYDEELSASTDESSSEENANQKPSKEIPTKNDRTNWLLRPRAILCQELPDHMNNDLDNTASEDEDNIKVNPSDEDEVDEGEDTVENSNVASTSKQLFETLL